MSERPRKGPPLRWLTLAEIVGLVAVVIAGLGWWDNHRAGIQANKERAAAAEARRAEAQAAARKPSFVMTGAPQREGEELRLTSVHPEQVIQTQTIWFPAAIRAESVETTGNPRLEADWLSGLRKAAEGEDRGRVPVGVLTVFIEDGQTKTDRAVYQVGYSLQSRMLRGSRIELEGLSLARRGVDGDLQATVDTLWAAR